MQEHATPTAAATPGPDHGWSPPGFELIPLDCEITAYAPDGDLPLF